MKRFKEGNFCCEFQREDICTSTCLSACFANTDTFVDFISHLLKSSPNNRDVITYRECLLFGVNTKYNSSNVMKIAEIARVCRRSEISGMFNT